MGVMPPPAGDGAPFLAEKSPKKIPSHGICSPQARTKIGMWTKLEVEKFIYRPMPYRALTLRSQSHP